VFLEACGDKPASQLNPDP